MYSIYVSSAFNLFNRSLEVIIIIYRLLSNYRLMHKHLQCACEILGFVAAAETLSIISIRTIVDSSHAANE